ncbi:MAG TPA: hypothetical protein PLD47_13340 [Aggregatilineales bacterium]|nr:hypothetical protein [Anaerolineales bacterium]HRE48703.1 hypothetical protein [Aggregatilineales bacterium]
MTESNDTSPPRPVRCPACGAERPELSQQGQKLYSNGIQVIGYVCAACGRTIHWGARKGGKPKKPGGE